MSERLSAAVARAGAPTFRLVHRLFRALRRKLTPAGGLLAAVLVASLVFGINTREAMVYQLFGLAVALFAVAALASLRLPLYPSVERTLPNVATAGVAFDYQLIVRSGARHGYDGLEVEDLLALPMAATPAIPATPEIPATRATRAALRDEESRAFTRFKVSADRTRNIFDRFVGYPRWVAFMRQRIGARIEAAELGTLPAGEARAVRMRCTPVRRGVLHFEAVRVTRPEPLGLLKAQARQALPETLVVMPRTYPLAPLQLPGSRRLQPGGVPFAGRVGEAEEFVSLRDYRPGDSPRRIHWKAWARLGRLVVKEYQDEFFVRHALVLDTFGHGDVECFEAAVSIAASHVMQPRSQDSLLDLMFVERRAYAFTQGRGLGAPAELLRVLASVSEAVSASQGGGFATLAETVMLGAARISGAICVLLAWDEPRRRLVASLRARGIPVRAWVVTADGQAQPPGPMASDPGNLRIVHPRDIAAELARS